jgi:hypothetical protein
MDGFERYLIEQGFSVYHYDCKERKLNEGYKHLSTLVNLDNRYIKGNTKIIWGLNEVGKPPTLIYPKLFQTDNEVNRYLQNKNFAELLKELEWQSINT